MMHNFPQKIVRSALIITALLTLSISLFASAYAHDIPITITLPGPPPYQESRLVPHIHACVPKFIRRETTSDPDTDVLIYKHLKIAGATRRAGHLAVTKGWIDTHGGGNVTNASPATTEKNCHGVTFDNGNSWLDDPSLFLRNCTVYTPPPPPPTGTVVIYRHNGVIMHSGRVIDTPPGKTGVWVHSQWGKGGNYDHEVSTVPKGEEAEFEFPPGTKQEAKYPNYGTPTYYTCP